MSTLPQVGKVVQLFSVGGEGCGHFRGNFSVLSVVDDVVTELVLDPREIHCEGVVEKLCFEPLTLLKPLTLQWNRELECWQAQYDGHPVVVNISGHYQGSGEVVS
jgi:hypothetical protein